MSWIQKDKPSLVFALAVNWFGKKSKYFSLVGAYSNSKVCEKQLLTISFNFYVFSLIKFLSL